MIKWIYFVIAILLVIAFKELSAPDDPRKGQPGETWLLQGADKECLVAGSRDTYSEAFLVRGRIPTGSFGPNAYFFLPNQTEVKILEVLGDPSDADRINYRKVEILSGDRKGTVAFCSIKSLQHK